MMSPGERRQRSRQLSSREYGSLLYTNVIISQIYQLDHWEMDNFTTILYLGKEAEEPSALVKGIWVSVVY